MKNILSILFFSFQVFSFAQSKIDSLEYVLKTAQKDTVKINTLNALSRELLNQGDYEKALQYANDALALCNQLLSQKNIKSKSLILNQFATAYNNIGTIHKDKGDYDKALEFHFKSLKIREGNWDKNGMADSYVSIGLIHYKKSDYDKALENYFVSLKIYEELGNKQRISMSFNNIGLVHADKGDYVKALEFYFKALKIYEEMGDKSKAIANSYGNIGIIHYLKGDYDKALEFHFKALKIREEIGDKKGMAMSYNNIGIIHDDKAELQRSPDISDSIGVNSAYRERLYNKALEFYFKGLKIMEEIGDKNGMAASYNNIGIIHDNKGDYDKALDFFFKALKVREEIGDKNGMAMSYNNIGMLYTASAKGETSQIIRQQKFSEAREYMNKGLALSKAIGAKDDTKESYAGLSELNSTLGNWKRAYEYHKLYSEVKDSIFNEESSKQIAEMQTKYETEKKELEIENLNKDNEIKNAEIKKQNFQKLAFAGGFGLMLILAFVIFRGYIQKKKANEIISAQKTEVEKQKEMVEEKNQSLEIAYKHIEEKNTEILDSIRYAKRIQEAILPPQKLVKTYLEQSFILYKPKDIVAGDFYWMETAENKVLFASVDCTGHGVPGAFVSILGYNGLNRCVKEFGLTKPSEILDKLCELVDEAFSKSENDIKDGMDIALCNLSITNPERDQNPFGIIQYAGAGNSLYHIRNGILTEYSPDKQPIGKFAYRKPFTNHEIQLEKGDSIYVFTDGYADQFGGPKGKKFKYKQFENLLLSIQDRTMEEQRKILNENIDSWRGEMEQIDDICIIGVGL